MDALASKQMDFSKSTILEVVEDALIESLGYCWSRVDADQFSGMPKSVRVLYKLDAAQWGLACKDVDILLIRLDHSFPRFEPTIYAPQANLNEPWPHVESHGKLCLTATQASACPGHRVLTAISNAVAVLNMDADTRRSEFRREFCSYWSRNDSSGLGVVSLVDLNGPSRAISWCYDGKRKRFVMADDSAKLQRWLDHAQFADTVGPLNTGHFLKLSDTPDPTKFPVDGEQTIRWLSNHTATEVDVRHGRNTPVLLGVPTETGMVGAVLVFQHDGASKWAKKFRHDETRVPNKLLLHSAAKRPILQLFVTRADGRWIHGRDKDPDYPVLKKAKVGYIGCGSLGSMIARQLAQAGVQGPLLVDPENLEYQNLSRHVLGQLFVGQNKAMAMKAMLERDFPHHSDCESWPFRWEDLGEDALAKLGECNLLICSGLSAETEASIAEWRANSCVTAVHLSTWVEAFALAGHAVAILGTDMLLRSLDVDGVNPYQVTRWPDNVSTMLNEAGCGNVFQPHGAAQLQHSASMTSQLAIDLLLKRETSSVRRLWFSGVDDVRRNGGLVTADAPTEAGCHTYQWTT